MIGIKANRHIAEITLVSYLVVLLSLVMPPCVMGNEISAQKEHHCCHQNRNDAASHCKHDCGEDHCDTCEIKNSEITTELFITNNIEIKFKKNDLPFIKEYISLIDSHAPVFKVSDNLYEQLYPPLHPLIKYRHLLI